MRTTLDLDDDVLQAVKELAAFQGSSAGKGLSDLARRAQTSTTPLRFTAQAHNLSTAITMPAQTPLEITVARWSSDGEREQLVASLKEGRHAHGPAQGVEHITLITDRPVGFWEAVDKPRTIEYRFMVVELQMNPGGRGKGGASPLLPRSRRIA